MYPLKLSTAITIPFFAHDANGDGVTGIADGSWTKRISKASSAFGAMTATIVEGENGWYGLLLDTGHTDTLGILTVSLSAAAVKRVNIQFRIHARVPDDLAFPNVSGSGLDVSVLGDVDANVRFWLEATPHSLLAGRVDANAQVVGANAVDAAQFTQAAADKVWASATRTLTSFGTLIGDIWAHTTRELTAFTLANALNVWNVLTASIVALGSIGAELLGIPLDPGVVKNTGLSNFPFVMFDANGDPAPGLTVTAQRSIDGAAFAATANSPAEIGSGAYRINLNASDVNGTTVILKFTAPSAKTTLVTIKTVSP